MPVAPPKLILRFFRWYCHPKMQDYIEGDLMEVYERRIKESGKRKADLSFMMDVILLFRPGIIRPTNNYRPSNPTDMFFNHLKLAIRNIRRSFSYSLINISGLGLGITCALLIFLLVTYHLSFDTFHHNDSRIYRFVTEQHRDQISFVECVPPAFGKAFRDDYTFGEKVARVCEATDQLVTIDVNNESNKFRETASFVDPEFFEIFNFPVVAGNRSTMLKEQNTAVITERVAKRFFGDESPLGKPFRLNNTIEFTISGIINNIPDNTDFRSEIYLSYSTIKQYSEWYASDDAWGGISSELQTFALLRAGVVPAEVEKVLPEYVKKFRPESRNKHIYHLQPLNDIHFNENYGGRMSKDTIWILAIIGFFLIFTACLNFINLATAQAVNRSKEVGVRKVLGSLRIQLFFQFTVETAVIVLTATLVAFSAAVFVLPYMNTLFDTRITLDVISNTSFLGFTMLLIFVVTILAGAYPGLILSGFKPVVALKGKMVNRSSGFNMRRSLVIAQFTISQVLLIGLIVIVSQMQFNKQTDMGFTHQGIIMMPAGQTEKRNALRDQMLQLPNIEDASLCFSAPASNSQWGTSFVYDNRTEAEVFAISYKGADDKYLSTFDIELIAGRNLTPSDTIKEFLVNEEVIKKLNLSSPEEILGHPIRINGRWTGPVVGVVANFHDQSFRSAISPVVITTSIDNYNELAVKIRMTDITSTLAAIEKTWTEMYPDQIYQYEFLDDQTAEFYEAEEAVLKVIEIFAFVALLIGCMGLYGLTSFMAVQKNKEIGIRKVLGGDTLQILMIFGREFSILVFIAFAIAAPIGWWLMSQWLEKYTYGIDMTLGILAIELAIILTIVTVTVGYQSLKAALMNPAKSLRSE